MRAELGLDLVETDGVAAPKRLVTLGDRPALLLGLRLVVKRSVVEKVGHRVAGGVLATTVDETLERLGGLGFAQLIDCLSQLLLRGRQRRVARARL